MRRSWDTSIKHLARQGVLEDVLTPKDINKIPRSNITRWKKESEDKYCYSEINEIIKQEIDLIKRLNKSSKIKKINQSYFKLADTFHQIISNIKGIKSNLKEKKELVVNTIEMVKDVISIDNALKIFNLSRSAFENYKSIVIHKCEVSYFKWCSKRFSNQLLPKEVILIKAYLDNKNYKYWSKASIYLKAVRDGMLQCSISTFYKYSSLLGYKNRKQIKKSDNYHPVKTTKPNELWCADVTVFKTADHTKHYIHFLIDHYSKMIIGYAVDKKPSALAIKQIMQTACEVHKPSKLKFLTDGGSENVNSIVCNFIDNSNIPITHNIAQRDVLFSNSMIEALNKVIKHQFLYPLNLQDTQQLKKVLPEVVNTYNSKRPQMSLEGNTPDETYHGMSINFEKYSKSFAAQHNFRRQINQKTICKGCL